MITNDRRTDAQKITHRYFTTATARALSGWGDAKGGASKCAWAWETMAEASAHQTVLKERGDLRHVSWHHAKAWKPRAAHLSIYVGRDE